MANMVFGYYHEIAHLKATCCCFRLYVKQKASGAKPENSLENEEKPTARKRKLSEEDADDGEQKIDRVESSYVGLKKQKLEINGTPVKSPAVSPCPFIGAFC